MLLYASFVVPCATSVTPVPPRHSRERGNPESFLSLGAGQGPASRWKPGMPFPDPSWLIDKKKGKAYAYLLKEELGEPVG